MKTEPLQKLRPFFLISAILGFLCINVPFLYITFAQNEVYQQALQNGLALVFMTEAFILMGFIAFLIAKFDIKKPGWIFFICMSIIGSLAFSIPFHLYLVTKPSSDSQ